MVVNVVVCAGVILIARRPSGQARPDGLLLALALLSAPRPVPSRAGSRVTDAMTSSSTRRSSRSSWPLFVPWRPTYSLRAARAHRSRAPCSPSAPRDALRRRVATSLAFATGLHDRRERHRESAPASTCGASFERANAQLAAADRMSSLGRMTAGIAHELKTPLAAVMNGLESIRSLSTELRESVGHPRRDHRGPHRDRHRDRRGRRHVSESGARRARSS